MMVTLDRYAYESMKRGILIIEYERRVTVSERTEALELFLRIEALFEAHKDNCALDVVLSSVANRALTSLGLCN